MRSFSTVLSCGLLVAYAVIVDALKFDIQAYPPNEAARHERCVRNFASKDTLVVVTATVSGSKGDGQLLNINIQDSVGNNYGKSKDVAGETRMAFTTHEDAAFDVCFLNTLNSRGMVMSPSRAVELDVDIGADAKDWNAIQASEKLKPVELEMRRIEEVSAEIVSELEYLREREFKLRNTNESTNERVKWFALGTMAVLVALGIWQVLYLRAYFRSKHLI